MNLPKTATTERNCMACGKALKGRSDKKFCDDYCRNNYNNQVKAPVTNQVRTINRALAKNRDILSRLLPEGEEMAKAPKEKLLEMGFQFRYLTHTYTNKKGNVYYFCYEYGYLPLDHDWYLIVLRKESE